MGSCPEVNGVEGPSGSQSHRWVQCRNGTACEKARARQRSLPECATARVCFRSCVATAPPWAAWRGRASEPRGSRSGRASGPAGTRGARARPRRWSADCERRQHKREPPGGEVGGDEQERGAHVAEAGHGEGAQGPVRVERHRVRGGVAVVDVELQPGAAAWRSAPVRARRRWRRRSGCAPSAHRGGARPRDVPRPAGAGALSRQELVVELGDIGAARVRGHGLRPGRRSGPRQRHTQAEPPQPLHVPPGAGACETTSMLWPSGSYTIAA